MRPRGHVIFGAFLFAFATLIASPAVAQNYGSETGELSITPGELTVAIAGDGFNPDSTVLVRLGVNGDGEEIGTLRADRAGAIEGEFVVPVVDGEIAALVAVGQTEDGATLTLSGSVGVGVGGELPNVDTDTGSDGASGDGDSLDGSDDDTDDSASDGEAAGRPDDGDDDGTSALTVVLVIAVVVLGLALAAVLFACRGVLPLLGGARRHDGGDRDDAGVEPVSSDSTTAEDHGGPVKNDDLFD